GGRGCVLALGAVRGPVRGHGLGARTAPGGLAVGRAVTARRGGAEPGAGSGLRGRVGGHAALAVARLHVPRLLDLDLEVEEVADRLLLDGLVHRLEELVALALVLHERVALAHGAQPDALLE